MQPSDKDIDKIIKDAGDNYQATGAAPDWAQMEALLDKHLPVKKEPKRKLLILLLLLLFLAGTTYIYFNRNSKDAMAVNEKKTSDSNIHIVPGRPAGNEAENALINDLENQPSPLLQSNQPNQNQQHPISKKSTGMRKGVKENSRISIYETGVVEYSLPDNPSTNAPALNSTSALINTSNENSNDIVFTNPTTQNKNTITENNPNTKTAATEPVIDTNKSIVVNEPATGNKKNKLVKKRKQPLEISLIYAPELTTIRFTNIDKPGSNYGLLLGYQITKKISLQTGIIKSRKNYIANGSDFELEYPLTGNYKLTKVNGYCMMYEIPLNIKSGLGSFKKFNVFYIAGISSYFMTREYYTYHYASASGIYSRSRTYTKQKNYWLSLASLGIGIEKAISPVFNIAAIPFLKIPFKGMGEGNLKLLSTGINFSLSYKPSFAKK